jgi:hypothetical protein
VIGLWRKFYRLSEVRRKFSAIDSGESTPVLPGADSALPEPAQTPHVEVRHEWESWLQQIQQLSPEMREQFLVALTQ